MTLNAWNGLPDPGAPANLREGEPYNDPKFEELARSYGIWGTAQSALCAQFWQAARRAPVVPQGWRMVPDVPTHEMQDACLAIVDLEESCPDDHRYNDGRNTVDEIFSAMLAAAPQPPEALPAFQTEAVAAAPVQLPEPVAYIEHHKAGDNLWFDHPGGKHSALYTEQQVRQLLAANGMQEKP